MPDTVPALLLPLAVWILASSLDDLATAVAWIAAAARRRPRLAPPDARAPEKRIAVLIPLWREHTVIRRMLEHNLAAIGYRNYEVFVGVYPNDEPTLDAVRECEAQFPKVHVALCPHDGPTSKADCLNCIWQRILLWEEERGARFDLFVLHDAEDLVHPQELSWMNACADRYAMIQIPVLPLRTPLAELTHGVYCDEFAEYQTKDLPARQALGGFIPSNGVGTGYTRAALETLGAAGAPFDPRCLTEDYDAGYRLARLGFPQLFVPIRRLGGVPMATREYFPRGVRQALRQRTRWVTGIGLQSWARHGWGGSAKAVYWFWRDRKGLIGNPVTVAANLLAAVWLVRRHEIEAPASPLIWATVALQTAGLAIRMFCVTRVYGVLFALGVPVRALWANWLNAAATLRAIACYAAARLRGAPLGWAKTDHAYPSLQSLSRYRRRLGELLVAAGHLQQTQLDDALASKPADQRLGEYLVLRGGISERALYDTLAMQCSLPVVELERVPPRIARALPREVARRWRVLPFEAADGVLHVAVSEIPPEALETELRRHTALRIRFHLAPASALNRAIEAVLSKRMC